MSYYIKTLDKIFDDDGNHTYFKGIIVSGRKEIPKTIWGYGSFLYGLLNIVKYK